MGIGTFEIIQIDVSLKATTIYQNWNTNNWGTPACPLQYLRHGHYTIRTKPPRKR